jgi:alkylation response protein AidB-like acyl-CoA dehydrogenase
MAASGLLAITIPRQWGGVGADTQSYALGTEEMSVGYAETNDVQRFLIADQVFSEVK